MYGPPSESRKCPSLIKRDLNNVTNRKGWGKTDSLNYHSFYDFEIDIFISQSL